MITTKEQERKAKENYHDCKAGTTRRQKAYEELARAGKHLSMEEAQEKVSQEFGFIKEKVIIHCIAGAYEANDTGWLRVKKSFLRNPVYAATDWNYIRFNVNGWAYEMVNGILEPYEC